jgi:hypothetical protein
MSSTPDPVDSGDLDLPRDPADYGPRRRGLGLAFWSMIVFGLLCVLAGVAIGRFGPMWFPVKPAPPPQAAPTAPASAVEPIRLNPAAMATPAGSPDADAGALGERVDRLEADQLLVARAAGEALAAASVSEAAGSSGPFADQLAPLTRLSADSGDWRTLEQIAQTGAPSRSSLAAEFADLADRAAVASRRAPEGAGLLTRLAHTLEAVFTIRRIDRLTGDDPDAVLARAQRQVDDGDLDGALKTLEALPPAGREPLADWRARAQRRLEVDRLVAAIRADAARDLAAAVGSGAAS